MRILYDAIPLLMRSAGVKNYHHALLSRLLPAIAPHTVELFPYLGELTPNRNEQSNYPPLATKLRLAGVLASNYLGLPYAAPAAARADLFHVTNHLQRPPGGVRLSSIIHDPTPLTMPDCHTPTNIRYFEIFVRKTLPRLQGVITPSEAVKRDIAARFSYPEEKIQVIAHGVDEDFFDATGAARQAAKAAYSLPEKYVLFLGALEPRKNLARLIEAYARLPEKLRRENPLVVAGASGWKNQKIRRAAKKARYVHSAGYIDRKLLPALYHMASVFAFPSLYEGFGMPLLEAMAAGVPVLTSNVSAMPEVAGEAAVYCDPRSVEGIAEALQALLEDPSRAALLGERGRARARLFTWEKTAQRTMRFFETVAGLEPAA